MNDAQLQTKLTELLALPHETEWVEFKHNVHESQMIGEYLSAISNSAALESQPFGYIVWAWTTGLKRSLERRSSLAGRKDRATKTSNRG